MYREGLYMKRVVAVDFETYYCKKSSTKTGLEKYSVRDLGNWAYVHHPLFDPYMISVCDGESVWAGHPDDFDWASLEGCTLLSHNAAFDRAVYLRMVELGKAPPGLDADWRCTADLAAYVCGRRALKDAVEHLLGIKVAKDVRDRASGKTVADMKKEGWYDDMVTYAERDALYCWRLWDEHSAKWPADERELSDLNIRQGWRGVGIDVPLLDDYIRHLEVAKFTCETSLPWVIRGEAKPTSTKAIAEECHREDIPCPPVKSGDEEDGDGEEAFDAWELLYQERFPWVAQISAWRKLNKMLKKFQLVKSRLRPDGTMGFGLKYFGAHTGRFSGDSGFNMQNLRMFPLFLRRTAAGLCLVHRQDENDALIELLMEKKPYPPDIVPIDERAILTAVTPGHRLGMADLSQIEPRVLNWLAGNMALLDRIRGGLPIYEAHARDSMGWTGGTLKKENPDKYKMAKVRVLGLGYGAGKDKFVTIAWTMGGLRISLETSEEQVNQFRESNPLIVDLWKAIDNAIKDSARRGEDFVVQLPSGRELRYEKPRIERRVEADEEGKPKSRMVVTAIIGGRRQMTYGAKIVENMTQAVARDVFILGYLTLARNGIDVLWSIHDEAVYQFRRGLEKEEARRAETLMSICPDWLPGCPVAAEVNVCDHYTK